MQYFLCMRPDHPVRFAATPPSEGNELQLPFSFVFFANIAEANQFPSAGGVAAKRTRWSKGQINTII